MGDSKVKRRLFSMILAIMVLFTSVDVGVFAREVDVADIVEVQEISGIQKEEEKISETGLTENEAGAESYGLEESQMEMKAVEEVSEDTGLLGVIYLPEQEKIINQEEVSDSYSEIISFGENEDLINVILDEYVSFNDQYFEYLEEIPKYVSFNDLYSEYSEEIPNWLNESSKYEIEAHIIAFRDELEEEKLELLEHDTTIKVVEVVEEKNILHIRAVEFIDAIAEDLYNSYEFTTTYNLELQIDLQSEKIT